MFDDHEPPLPGHIESIAARLALALDAENYPAYMHTLGEVKGCDECESRLIANLVTNLVLLLNQHERHWQHDALNRLIALLDLRETSQ